MALITTPIMGMRPLQPRADAAFASSPVTARAHHRPLSSSSSSASATMHPPTTYSAPSIGMKRKATTACRNCQKKRTRCSAGWPCSNCARSNIECHYAPLADRRRKDFANAVSAEEMAALVHKIADHESQLAFFRRIWSCLQADDERHALDLLSLIRKRASHADLADFLDRSASPDSLHSTADRPAPASSHPRLASGVPPAPAVSRRAPSMRALCDDPVLGVPAYPWTTVTPDDAFVSHLVSLWFTWSQPYMSWIHRDLFVRDMRSGNLKSTFCSRFLVNAICAQACAWSDYPEANAVPGDKSTAGMHFHEQARREYELLEGKTSITVVQGVAVFALATMLAGKDRRGWHLLQSAVTHAKELKAMPRDSHPIAAESDGDKLDLVWDRVEWGLYNFVTCASLSLQVEPLMTAPRRSQPPPDHHRGDGLSWRPYPHPAPETRLHEGCYISNQCSLILIADRINRLLYPGEHGTVHPAAVQDRMATEILEDLRVWRTTLPDCLELKKFNIPSLLTLYMLYEGLVISIGSSLRFKDGSMWDSLGPYDQALSSAMQQRSPGSIRCFESAMEMARLFEVFFKSWGLERTPVCFNHWATMGILTLLESLADTNTHAAFNGLCRFLRAACRRWVLARSLMRTVQLRAREMGVCKRMPAEAYAIFEDFEARDWLQDKSEECGGFYPNLFSTSLVGGQNG